MADFIIILLLICCCCCCFLTDPAVGVVYCMWTVVQNTQTAKYKTITFVRCVVRSRFVCLFVRLFGEFFFFFGGIQSSSRPHKRNDTCCCSCMCMHVQWCSGCLRDRFSDCWCFFCCGSSLSFFFFFFFSLFFFVRYILCKHQLDID